MPYLHFYYGPDSDIFFMQVTRQDAVPGLLLTANALKCRQFNSSNALRRLNAEPIRNNRNGHISDIL